MQKPAILFLSSTEGLSVLRELATLVRQRPDPEDWATAIVWDTSVFSAGGSFLDSLVASAAESDFAVVLLGPDDQLINRGSPQRVPRDNVIFEAGLSIGLLGSKRAVLVVQCVKTKSGLLKPKLPSDLDGIVRFEFSLPEGYTKLPDHEQAERILEVLNPLKTEIRKHIVSQWSEPAAATPVESPSTIGKFMIRPRRGGAIVPVYYDLTDNSNWFSKMANLLESPSVSLPSEMVYYGPGFAYQWLHAADGVGNSAQWDAFETCFSTILLYCHDIMGSGTKPISVVDLGIGDCRKGDCIIRDLLIHLGDTQRRIHYIAYDISFEMVCTALVNVMNTGIGELKRQQGHEVLGVNAPFRKLGQYGDLLGDGPRIFLLLGNTLGNEINERVTLAEIAEGMRPDDLIIFEVQLMEPEPVPIEELTQLFNQNKTFYAGPLLALGCQDKDISVRAIEDLEKSRGIDCWTYTCECTIDSVVQVKGPLPRPIRLGGGQTITTYVIHKYAPKALNGVMKDAGLEILLQIESDPIGPRQRRFQYIVAKRA